MIKQIFPRTILFKILNENKHEYSFIFANNKGKQYLLNSKVISENGSIIIDKNLNRKLLDELQVILLNDFRIEINFDDFEKLIFDKLINRIESHNSNLNDFEERNYIKKTVLNNFDNHKEDIEFIVNRDGSKEIIISILLDNSRYNLTIL